MATPPNFLWQTSLESQFPGFNLKKVEVDDGGKGVQVEKVLNVKNTIIKVVLDQTVAALPNVAGYVGVTRLLRGVPFELAWEAVKQVRCNDGVNRCSILIQIPANCSCNDIRIQTLACRQCCSTCLCAGG